MATILCQGPGVMQTDLSLSAEPWSTCLRLFALFPITVVLLLCSQAFAEVEFGVDIDLGVIRSNNILLAPDGEEQSETVYTIAPQFYLTSDDDRFQANIRYLPQAFIYSEFEDADEVFHTLDASLTTVLVRDKFFLALDATNFQSVVTPDARVPSSNLPISGNRTDARVLRARPYWQQRLGQADLLIEAAYTDFEYDDSQYQSSNARDGYLQLGNIQRQQGFAWQIDYRYRRTEYEISAPWEFQRAALNLGAWINGSTRLFVAGGAETSFDDVLSSNMDADFWEAGFQYAPNQRLNLEVAAGDRSYGTSFRGNFSYQLKRGEFALTYNEGPANRSELLTDRGPITSSDNLDGLLDRAGESDRFVRKRGEFRANAELSKSDLTVRIFSETRELRSTAEGDILGDEELSGAAVSWSWRFGNKTTLGVGADFARRNQSGFDDELRRAEINFNYQLTQKLGLRLEAARFDQKGKESSDLDYAENQYRLFLRTSF